MTLLDDLMDDRQAESRATAFGLLLHTEERLEYSRQVLLRNAAAGVLDLDHSVVARLDWLDSPETLGDKSRLEPDGDFARALHGIRCVDDQVRDRARQVIAGNMHHQGLFAAGHAYHDP